MIQHFSLKKKKTTKQYKMKPPRDTNTEVVVVFAKENEVQWAVTILAC